MLADFRGALQTDGYLAYESLRRVLQEFARPLTLRASHCRRRRQPISGPRYRNLAPHRKRVNTAS